MRAGRNATSRRVGSMFMHAQCARPPGAFGDVHARPQVAL
jgi:hypothetical protein